VIVSLLAFVTVLNAYYATSHPLHTDLAWAYIQARVVLTMGWAHAYDPAALEQQRQLIQPAVWYLPNYPPLLTVLILPFATLPLPIASWLWTGFISLVLVACWYLVTPAAPLRERLLWLLVALALPPVTQAFRWHALLAAAVLALTLAWRLDRGGHQWLAGIILAFAALKPQLAFLLPVALIASGRWRTVLSAAVVCLGLAATSVALLGPIATGQLVATVRTGLHSPMTDLVEPYLGLATLIPKPYMYEFIVAVAVVVAVAAWRSRRAGVTVAYAVGLAGSQVATPFIHPGDWAVTGLAVAILLAYTGWRWRRQVALASFVAALAVLGANGNPLGFVTLAWLVVLVLDPIRSRAPAPAETEPARPVVAQEPASG
jgi:hypothetical protein